MGLIANLLQTNGSLFPQILGWLDPKEEDKGLGNQTWQVSPWPKDSMWLRVSLHKLGFVLCFIFTFPTGFLFSLSKTVCWRAWHSVRENSCGICLLTVLGGGWWRGWVDLKVRGLRTWSQSDSGDPLQWPCLAGRCPLFQNQGVPCRFFWLSVLVSACVFFFFKALSN